MLQRFTCWKVGRMMTTIRFEDKHWERVREEYDRQFWEDDERFGEVKSFKFIEKERGKDESIHNDGSARG